MFPGPLINSTTNDMIHVNVFNNLDEPLLFTWYVCMWVCIYLCVCDLKYIYIYKKKLCLNFQEWHTTEAKFMARWGFRHQLSYWTWEELDLRLSDQRPDWHLLLLPLHPLSKGCRRIWSHSCQQSKCDPCTFSETGGRIWSSDWRLDR